MTTTPTPDHAIAADFATGDAFKIIFEAIDKAADELKMQSAEASLEGEFIRVNAIAARYERLQDYRKKMARLEREWRKIVSIDQPKTRTKLKMKPQNVTGKMRVLFDDETIEKADNQATFEAALSKIGLERIAVLEKNVDGKPLLSYRSTSGEENPLFDGQWHIQQDIHDALKRKLLKSIAKKLSIHLSVEFAEPPA